MYITLSLFVIHPYEVGKRYLSFQAIGMSSRRPSIKVVKLLPIVNCLAIVCLGLLTHFIHFLTLLIDSACLEARHIRSGTPLQHLSAGFDDCQCFDIPGMARVLEISQTRAQAWTVEAHLWPCILIVSGQLCKRHTR
jgi:hypothetical protein